MCGIIGYVTKEKTKTVIPILLDGLKKLEYRGYDSAGVAFLNENKVDIIKESGPIVNLEKSLNKEIESNIGIGHTRWATHGKATKENSHPHRCGKMTIVHNGIIENYLQLKDFLQKENYNFISDTDTEVAAALIDYLYEESGNVLDALNDFIKKAKGAYAIAIICDDFHDRLFVIKKASPLIIGVNENENFIASDVPAILDKTNKYIILEDKDYAEIYADKINVYRDKKQIKYKINDFKGDKLLIDKQGYEHFMLKEIHEQPDIIKNLIDRYLKKEFILPDITKYQKIIVVGCGSAYHAGLIGKYLIEKNLNIEVSCEIASEFRYKKLFLDKDSLVIAISQSGETADTLAAVKISKACKAHTLGIVNVKESSIAREVDDVIYTEAGTEIAVATTKAYSAQVLMFILLSLEKNVSKIKKLKSLPLLMQKLINQVDDYKKVASYIQEKEHLFFIGRLIDYAVAMEGSLKLKEISYIHSEAYASGELKHGTISLIEKGTPVVALVSDKSIAEKTLSNIKEVKARDANVVLIVSEESNLISDCYDYKIVLPSILEEAYPLLMIIPLQLISYEVAKLRKCSIDKPKNLAKSVTVE